MKPSETIFHATSKNGKLLFHNIYDSERFLRQYEDLPMIVTMKPFAKTGAKMRMYAFYHGPLLDCAMIGFNNQGYEGIDKVKADYLLRAEFAKDYIKKPNGEYVVHVIDKSNMTKDRFVKYLTDCIMFIEQELQMEIPDSEAYKMKKETGRNYTTVK
jgi:hypothetical protein